MSKFDNQLDRMKFLMDYDNTINESTKKGSNGIEYHTTGADGKEYGIIREGLNYYIKTTTPDKAQLAESYDYINGHNYRSETRYNSFNEASKQLELRLMNLNESKGIHKDVTIANTNSNNEAFATLTESARKELDRMQCIFENSFVKKGIGSNGHVGSSAPFNEKVTADMNLDGKNTKKDGTVDKNNTKVTDVEDKMTSTKAPKGSKSEGNSKASVDLDGECVATKECKGNKPVVGKLNEGIDDIDTITDYEETPSDIDTIDMEGDGTDITTDTTDIDMGMGDGTTDVTDVDIDDQLADNGDGIEGDSLVGDDVEGEDDLDALLREYEEIYFGNNDTLEGKQNGKNGSSITTDTVDNKKPSTACGKDGCEGAMKGGKGTLPVQTCDRLNETKKVDMKKVNESINRITDMVYENLMMENMKETIDRIVKEEVTRLNVFGKHPRYGKPFMTLPDNHEVMRGTADRDWNDDSAKGNAPYGRKIGSSAPFDQMVDNMTEKAMTNILEALGLKK